MCTGRHGSGVDRHSRRLVRVPAPPALQLSLSPKSVCPLKDVCLVPYPPPPTFSETFGVLGGVPTCTLDGEETLAGPSWGPKIFCEFTGSKDPRPSLQRRPDTSRTTESKVLPRPPTFPQCFSLTSSRLYFPLLGRTVRPGSRERRGESPSGCPPSPSVGLPKEAQPVPSCASVALVDLPLSVLPTVSRPPLVPTWCVRSVVLSGSHLSVPGVADKVACSLGVDVVFARCVSPGAHRPPRLL